MDESFELQGEQEADKDIGEVQVLAPSDSILAQVLQFEYNKEEEAPMTEKQIAKKTASDAYMHKLNNAHYNRDYTDNLKNLLNMGFTDFVKNLNLLMKNDNNVETVCTLLLVEK